jgi:gliding motility-associated-like protein
LTLKSTILLVAVLAPAIALQAQQFGNIEFIENKGQWDARVKYKGDVSNGSFFIRSGGFTIVQNNPEDLTRIAGLLHGTASADAKGNSNAYILRSHAWNVDFIGASPEMRVVPDKKIETHNNYFIGNDPSKWASNCRIYQAVTLENIYPNVDARYYTDKGTLKYDIIVRPGGDVSKIALKYQGADKLEVKNKELVISTSLGELRESVPYTFQGTAKGRKEIGAKYVVKDNIVRFDIKEYDRNATLVIDPTLIFCSFSGSTSDNWGYTATYGPDGSFFGAGIVHGIGFPVNAGAYQTNFAGGFSEQGVSPIDMGIIKLSPSGGNRLYATYLGGSGNDQPHSLIVDGQGNLVIAGRSNSSNYPVTAGTSGLSGANYDIVITKLNAAGSDIIGSKKIGGSGDDGVNISASRAGANSLQQNYGDDGRSEVILDGGGNIYVASCTRSADFPVSGGAFQQTSGGGTQDGVVIKFDASVTNRIFSSYIGGDKNDAAYVLCIGPNGNLYVAGGTESDEGSFLPGTHGGTVGSTHHGLIDGFVAEMSNNGSSVVRSTFIGTSGVDQVYGIQFDRNGFPYVMGQTTGGWQRFNIPATNTISSGAQFVAKLQMDLSAFVYSLPFGTGGNTPNISPIAFLVDRCENVYVSGWGGDISQNAYPSAGTTGMPVTSNAIKPTTDGRDLYFFVLERDAKSLLYATFFGQNGGATDHVDGGTSRFDQNGIIYQAICGNCKYAGDPGFPVTAGAWATTNPSSNCNLAMVKIEFDFTGVGSNVSSAINGVPRDTAGCVPLTVDFTDQSRTAQSYIWDFGDGTPPVGPLPAATGFTQSHLYTSVGTYRVMLIAIDPTSCNIRDTSYINIKVGDLIANLDFVPVKIGPCTSFQYQFNNLSTAPPSTPFSSTAFSWNFGDNTPPVIAGMNPVTHTYPRPGSYTVILTLRDSIYCNFPVADTFVLDISDNVDAIFFTDPAGCVPYTATFRNESVGGLSFQWFFGDGNTSTAANPTHTYNTPGTYNVVLVATDPNTCNVTDTARFTITVHGIPTANFTFSPITPDVNTPHTFTNTSSLDAVRFRWEFGDGDTLITTSRLPVQHQYNATGTFTACLIAYNAGGCADTLCQDITTTVVPLVDVPNAFTPQSGGINSIVMPRGFGISKMRFIIWNRWGQKLFETASRNTGWDGKYKGQLQPMDVYAYTLDIEFFDGTKTTRKGDITLIR